MRKRFAQRFVPRLHNCKRNCTRLIRTRLNVVQNIYLYLPLPPASCVRLPSAVLIARLPVIVRATSRETCTFYLASQRVYFSREEHGCAAPTSGQRIIAE